MPSKARRTPTRRPAAKRPVGRPAFKPTATMRKTVELMVACGDNQDMVARAIGCTADTLRLHFDEELKNGYAKKRREVLMMMEKGARKGNATLIKRLEEMTRMTGAAADFDRQTKGSGKASDPAATEARTVVRTAKPGKKEIQREDAFNAGLGTEWEGDLGPLPGTKPN